MDAASPQIRVVLVDDHAVLRDGLRAIIETEADIHVVAEAEDGAQALEAIVRERPDIVLLDLNMPRMGGMAVLEELNRQEAAPRVVVLTMYDDPAHLRAVLGLGAAGYVVKRAAASQLVTAIREVCAGRAFIHASLSDGDIRQVVHERGRRGDASETPLSDREETVLRLVAEGYTNREIAEQLDVSKKSIDTYRRRVADKLGFKNRAAMVRYAIETGLLTSSEA